MNDDDLVKVTLVTKDNVESLLDILAPKNLEQITDELIIELSGAGIITEEELIEFRDSGFLYNRARNSFTNPEFSTFDFFDKEKGRKHN
jgi:NAD-dependent SIR2 family protein deacetylase